MYRLAPFSFNKKSNEDSLISEFSIKGIHGNSCLRIIISNRSFNISFSVPP